MTSRPDRASLREGPLTELFRSTEAPAASTTAEAPVETPPVPAEELLAPDPPFRADEANNYLAVIRVVGVGGAGCNAINRMVHAGLRGVEFVAINTDSQALDASTAALAEGSPEAADDYDAALERWMALGAADFEARKPLLDRIQEIIVSEQPYAFLVENTRLVGLNSRVKGADINDASVFFNIDEWYIEQ